MTDTPLVTNRGMVDHFDAPELTGVQVAVDVRRPVIHVPSAEHRWVVRGENLEVRPVHAVVRQDLQREQC